MTDRPTPGGGRAFHFELDDHVPGFTLAHASGRVGLTVGRHEHVTTLHLSPHAARALAKALTDAADFAEAGT